jgi:hypothetical protein
MEAVGAVVGISDVALRASSKLWTLFGAWKDAPADLHRLRDELSRTHRFFGETQQGIEALYSIQHGFQKMSETHASTSELELLVNDGMVVLERIDQFIDTLTKPSVMNGLPDVGKRRRVVWMASAKKVSKWKSELRAVTSDVCRLLIVQNMHVPPLLPCYYFSF